MRTQTGVEEVYLTKRVGFVKLAMTHRAALVPCYAFGTTDLYDITPRQHATNSKGYLWTLSKKYVVAMPLYQVTAIIAVTTVTPRLNKVDDAFR